MTHTDRHTDLLDFPGAAALERSGRIEPLDPAVQARAHSLVLGAIAAETGAPAASAPAAGPRPGRRRMLVCAAAVAAVAAAVAVFPVTGDEPTATASASEVFTAMADRAAAGRASDAPYWKTTVRRWVEGNSVHTDDTYLSRDGVFIRMQNGKTVIKENPAGTSWLVGDREVGWDGLGALPTRPDALRRALAAGAGGEDAAAEQTVMQAGRLLTDAPVPPGLRAALYRVLAGTPGARVTEGVKDGAGRTGTEVFWKWTQNSREHSDHNPHWIMKPSDGRLLERNYTPGGEDHHTSQRDTYLHAGPANSTR